MKERHRNIQKFFLVLAVIAAFGLHGGALYFLYDLSIPLADHGVKKNLFYLTLGERRELNSNRNQDLSDLFLHFREKFNRVVEVKEEFASLSPEFAPPPPICFGEETAVPTCDHPLSPSFAFDYPSENQDFLSDEHPDEQMVLNLPDPAALLPKELERAFIAAKGEVKDASEFVEDKGLNLGITESEVPSGMDVTNHSGLLIESGDEWGRTPPLNFSTQPSFNLDIRGGPPEVIPPPHASIFSLIKRNANDDIACSEHFDMTVEYTPKCSRPGYVFKITLLPKKEITFRRIHHNFFFLLDRSNSMLRNRYNMTRRAIAEALSLLKSGDTFNILVFDDRVTRLSPDNLPWTPENVAKARLFLERQPYGSFFSKTDLYASLEKILPKVVSDTQVNTAILFTDGETYLSNEKQRILIGKWTRENGGRVSLFSIASGRGNNLPLLELLTTFNKGKLVYAPEHEQVKQRLVQLIKRIRNPVGKSVVATAVTLDEKTVVLLQPKNCRLPDLYHDRPFILYGSTNRLSDFTLFLQGKYYDRGFDIKKRISFKNAGNGTLSLEREWTKLLANDYFERYFKDGDTTHLESAQELLGPLNIPVPFLTR
ncbi:MAG: VWA domain-containing protein [Chlamydiia bacterium]|nr:VWA domain-containing protein [Chlamydiia bacterium]